MKNQHITLIFCHGWAYTSDVFAQLISDLKFQLQQNCDYKSINIYNLDLEFFGLSSNLQNTANNSYLNSNLINESDIKNSILAKLITNNHNNHVVWVGHSYGLMHGKLYYSDYISKYIGINSLLGFSNYKAEIKAMLKQLKTGNTQEVLHNFYLWCGDKPSSESELLQNHHPNLDKLSLCLQNMYTNTAKIWLSSTNQVSILSNKYDVFKFENKNNIDIDFIQVECMQNPHILPKISVDVCVDFIVKSILI